MKRGELGYAVVGSPPGLVLRESSGSVKTGSEEEKGDGDGVEVGMLGSVVGKEKGEEGWRDKKAHLNLCFFFLLPFLVFIVYPPPPPSPPLVFLWVRDAYPQFHDKTIKLLRAHKLIKGEKKNRSRLHR